MCHHQEVYYTSKNEKSMTNKLATARFQHFRSLFYVILILECSKEITLFMCTEFAYY